MNDWKMVNSLSDIISLGQNEYYNMNHFPE